MKTRLPFVTRLNASFKKIFLFAVSFLLISAVFADVIVTGGTSGTNISADKAANASTPLYTVLGDIVITESDDHDFFNTGGSSKTLILTAPAGWAFNPGAGSVSIASALDFTAASITVDANTITITYDVNATSNIDILTISGIEVQAVDGSLIPSAGNIYCATGNPGTASIDGLNTTANTNGTGGDNFGSLSQVVGDAATLVFTIDPASATVAVVFGQQPVIETQDQFGNFTTNGLAASQNVTLNISFGTGTLSGTSVLDIGTAAGNGTVTFTDLSIDAAGVKKLMATSGSLTFGVTNNFTVSQAGTTITISSDNNPSCFSTNITLTANVSPAIATGTVEFFDGVTSLGTSSVTAGVATLVISSLTTASHALTAVYSGDADYLTSTSAILTQVIDPGTPAIPGTISGTATQCPGLINQVYSIAAVTDATTYTWTVPTGWTITAGAGTTSITVTTGAFGDNGNITVTAGNPCGTSIANSLAVTVGAGTPAIPGTISGTATQCPGLINQVYSIAAVTNATTYTWTVPTGWTITAGAGTTSITVTTGAFGDNGNITVTAGNSCGTSTAQSFAVSVDPATPAAPTANAGTGANCSQITANWSAAANAATYFLDVSTVNTFVSFVGIYNNLNVGNVTTLNVTGLTAGITYYYRVRAANSCGTSVSSATITYATLPAAPAAPTANAGTSATCSQITANWSAAANATTYFLDVSTVNTFVSFVGIYNNLNVGNVTTLNVTGLTGGITYYYRIRANNSCGTSISSSTITYATTPSTPATPTANAGTGAACSQITANWSATVNATTYFLDVSTVNTFVSFVGIYNNLNVGNVTTLNVTGLTAGITYYYRVRAGNSCGTSASSLTITYATLPATPAAPTANAGTGATCSQITANWSAAANATTYFLDVSTVNTFASFVGIYNNLNVGNVTTLNVTGLTAGITYYYRVRASNSCGTSVSSAMITYAPLPATPVTPTANAGTGATCSQITANWSAAANATVYFLDVSTVNTFVSFVGIYNNLNVGNVTTLNITGLSSGVTYYYRVRASNSCGTSVSSSTITYATSPSAPATPGAISGTTPVCPNAAGYNYSIAAVANATTYTWAVPAGWSITSGQGTTTVTVTSGVAGGNITVTAGNSCGTSGAAQVININPVIATNNTGFTDNNGPKSSDIITVNAGIGERRGYLKFPLSALPAGAIINSSVLKLTNNGSTASAAINNINALDNNEPVATAAATLYNAVGTGANYNSSIWNNVGTISLTLNAAANTDIQSSITAPAYLAIGLLRGGTGVFNFFGYSGGVNAPVLTINYSSISSFTVAMNPAAPATPGVITGLATTCSNTSGNVYSIAAVPNATTYTWTVPAGWTINSGQGTISISVTAGNAGNNGNITVTAGNSCGTSGIRTKAVTVDQVPTTSNAGAVQNICLPTTAVTLAANIPSVGTGAWTIVSGPSLLLSQFSNTTNPSATFTRAGGAGTYQLRWTITNGTCTSQSTVNIVYTAAPANPNISFDQTMNVYSQTIITCGPIGGGGQNDIDIYNYTPPGGSTFTWEYSTNAGPWTNSGLPNTSVTYPIAAFAGIIGVHQFRLIMQTGGCTVTSNTITLTVNPTSSIGSTTANACSGVAFAVSPTGLPGGTTYTWTSPTVTGGMTGAAAGSGASITGNLVNNSGSAQTATYTVSPVYTVTQSCAVTFTVTVTVNPKPTVSAVSATQTKCSGVAIGTITITNPNSVSGTTFGWTRNNTGNLTGMAASGSGSTIDGTLTNNTGAQQTTIFTITATAGSCSSTTTVSVVVNPAPVANAGGGQTLCSSLTSTIIGGLIPASGGTGPYTYSWSPATGLSSSTIANPTATPPSYPYVYALTVTDANGCNSVASNATLTQGSVTKTWNGDGVTGGTGDNNFNNPQNWIPTGVPSDCNDVVMNVDFATFIFGTLSNINFNSNVIIKSLSVQMTGFQFLNFTPTVFNLNVAGRSLSILNNTTLTTNCSGIPVSTSSIQVSVAAGGVVTYGGNLTTTGMSVATNLVYPLYASTNNTGKFYLNGNATLAGIGNDPANKPAQVIFDGTGTQTITNNSGTQTIYLGATSTDIGETNSPTVVLAGTGTNGFRNIGNLNINNTSTLDIGTTQAMNRNSAGGSINMAAGSFMKLGRNTGGVGTSNFPSFFSTFNFNATSTVDYNGAIPQNINPVPLYGNLTLSGTGNKNPAANLNVQKNITIAGAAILIGGTYTFTLGGNWTNYNQSGFLEQTGMVDFNSTGAQSINTTGGEIFYSLRKTASGTTTMLSDVAVQGGGTSSFTLSAGTFDAGTFTFNSAASPLNISAGLLKLGKTGAALLPEFAITPYNITGGTIELYGAGNQVLRGSRDYRNLTFSNSGIKTISSAITNITGTVTTANTAILDVSNNTMGGVGTNLTMTGSSVYKTAGTGTKPDALGTYTLGTGTTVEFNNMSALTTEDIRLTLPTYYNLVVSGTNVANPSAVAGINFQPGGSFTVKNAGIFKLGNTNGFSGAATTAVDNTNNPNIILEDGSTVEYYGGPTGAVNQFITNVIPYAGLTFSGSSVKTAPAGILSVKGNLSNLNSVFAHNNGTVLLSGTAVQNYNSAGTPLTFYNLTSGNPVNVNVNNDLNIVKQLSLSTSGKLNMVSGNITLRSDATNTANVDKINTNDAITYGTGRFIIERYIPTGTGAGQHNKAWQLLAAPVNGTQTVKAAWQESAAAPNANPVSGYGTMITSNFGGNTAGANALGFDVYTAPGPTVKTYNPVTNGWDGIANTNTLPIANPKGYMVFVRGDRSVIAFNQAPVPTVLRTTGKLFAPSTLITNAPPSTTVLPGKFESIGNPYASAIDFTLITKPASPDVDDKFYVWDPLLTNNYNGLGGYQTISASNAWKPIPGGTTNYDANTVYQTIQSGQAFFVYATGAGGTVSFTEACKINNSAIVYRAPASLSDRQFLRVSLFNGPTDAAALSDGNVVAFDSEFSNDCDADDALKIGNTGENFGIKRGDKFLALEARRPVVEQDTVYYSFNNLRRQAYQLRFNPENMGSGGMTAYLVDKFLNTSAPVSLDNTTAVDFTITTDAGSYAADRFYVVFKALRPVPVTITSIAANRNNNGAISVDWKVENEISMEQYEVERSADGRNFSKINVTAPKVNNGGSAGYNHLDENPLNSDNFYRIKALSRSGQVQYSAIVKVAPIKVKPAILVYPNPVAGRIMNIHFTNQPAGDYSLQLINKLGQTVYRGAVNVSGIISIKSVPVESSVSAGNYQLSVTAPGGSKYVQQLIIE